MNRKKLLMKFSSFFKQLREGEGRTKRGKWGWYNKRYDCVTTSSTDNDDGDDDSNNNNGGNWYW